MIHIFRKEMKKWNSVLWVVLAALVFGYGGVISYWGGKENKQGVIGSVNGRDVFFTQYRHALSDINSRLTMLRQYSRMYGFSEDMFLRGLLGGGTPEDVALNNCVQGSLWDGVIDDFNITVADAILKQELIKAMPKELTDEQGYINMDAYRNYLAHMSMTPAEFEEARARDVRKDVIQKALQATAYVPSFLVRQNYEAEHGAKQFVVTHITFDRFLEEAKKEQLDEKAFDLYFQSHKEQYRVPERKKVRYWVAQAKAYAEKIIVDESMIKAFYDKNKGSMFRIPPQVKVQRLVIAADKGNIKDAEKKASDILAQAKASPETFTTLVKKYSEHASVKEDGLVDFFSRGKHDKAFEDAAFKLMNPLDLSPVVKTVDGYEIIQLVERKKASEKPLSMVRDQIEKDLHSKKAIQTLRADLETMMHGAKTNVSVLHDFVKQSHFSEQETDWLTAQDARAGELQGVLAQKAFEKKKHQASYGYFMQKDDFIIYEILATQKSEIPARADIKENVLRDYQQYKAEKKANDLVLSIKNDILTKKISIKALAEKYNLALIETDMIKPADEVKGLDRGCIKKLFLLNDKAQVAEYRQGNDYYIGQLVDMAPIDEAAFAQEKNTMSKNMLMRNSRDMASGFIASLHRIAKIEIDKNTLNKTMPTRD